MASNSKQSSGDNKAVKVAGVEPVAVPDWRSQLMPETRQKIVTEITNTMKRYLSEDFNLEEIATRFEEKIYGTATSQTDYLKKISHKMLSMESKTQGPQINTASNPNLQNLQHPNPGSGASQINSTNQSMPPVTQPPPVSMASLPQAPGGNISLAQQQQMLSQQNGLNLLLQQQQQFQMQQNGLNLLQQQYLLRQQQHLIQMHLNQIQQHQIMNNNNSNMTNNMTNKMINVNAVQQQQMLMWQNQMMNMNNTNNTMMNMNNTNNNMMMRAGGNNMNNGLPPQMSCRSPIQQGLNYINSMNNNVNNNMMQWQQQQRSVGMLQGKNNASMDLMAQKGTPPGQLEVVCQKQQMVSQPNEGLKERLIMKNEEKVHGSWVNPAAKILVLLVIMLVLIHTVHELGFHVFRMFE